MNEQEEIIFTQEDVDQLLEHDDKFILPSPQKKKLPEPRGKYKLGMLMVDKHGILYVKYSESIWKPLESLRKTK